MSLSIRNDQVVINGKACTVQVAKIDAASAGNNTLVAAVTGKKIRVTAITIVCAADVAITFQDGAGGTGLTGAMSFKANGGMDVDRTPPNFFCETSAGNLLNMSLGGAVQVSGTLNYVTYVP